VAAKELTGLFLGCMANKGATDEFFVGVANKELMGICEADEGL
jgi:hypothetical protein